jgi:hypothetical protein
VNNEDPRARDYSRRLSGRLSFPRRRRRWNRVPGATIHEGYMDFTKKHDVNDVIRISRHLKDVVARVILKIIGYSGTYEPVTMRSYGPHRVNWVAPTTEPKNLGFE